MKETIRNSDGRIFEIIIKFKLQKIHNGCIQFWQLVMYHVGKGEKECDRLKTYNNVLSHVLGQIR